MVETVESKRRSRLIRIGSTVGVVVAAALVVWGLSRSSDDRSPSTPPTIGVIQNPAVVLTTQGAIPTGSVPGTVDVPTVPTGTADIGLPPVTNDLSTP